MNTSSIPNSVDKWVNNIHEQNMEQSQESIGKTEPHFEMEFLSEAEAYEFYNKYSKRVGFGIRREYSNKSRIDGVLTSRRFTCFKEGSRVIDKRRNLAEEPKAKTITGCLARIIISLDQKIEKYKVVDFVAQHNHSLLPPEYVHMIHSHRHISEAQESQIVLGEETGLRPKDLHEYVSNKSSGIETTGFYQTRPEELA